MLTSSSLEQAITDLRQGKPVILIDSSDRENEGDFVIAAERANQINMRLLLRYSTRMICVSMEEERLRFLGLEPVTRQPTKPGSCCFYTPVDARHFILLSMRVMEI